MATQKKGENDMAQIYQTISIVTFSLAAVSLILAVVLWFKFDIWKIIGDLSGRTAKKSIEHMRSANEASGRKSYRPTPVAESRGKLTEQIVYEKKEKEAGKSGKETDVLKYSPSGTEVLPGGTEILETGVMNQALAGSQSDGFEAFDILQSIVLIHTEEVI